MISVSQNIFTVPKNRSDHFRFVARSLLYVHSAALVTLVFLFYPGINGYKRAMFGDMLEGVAYRPHVYRVLVPYTARILSSQMPEEVKTSLRVSIKDTRLAAKLGWDSDNIPAYVVVTLITFCCFLGFAFALRKLSLRFYPNMISVADFAPALGLLVLPSLFRYYNQLYDPATLLLWACALLFLAQRAIIPYYVFFVLAVINKETAILLVPLFALAFRETTRIRKIALHVGLQLIVFGVIRIAVLHAYAANPGGLLEFHLNGNLLIFEKPGAIVYLLAMYGLGGYLVSKNWHSKPSLLRLGILFVFAPLVLLSLFFGNLDEPRQYYEAFPFVFLLSLKTINDAWNVSGNSSTAEPP
jgi:hypothetical protein